MPFDLLGHPVPANKGCKGRPQHAPTAENLEKIVLTYAMGGSDADAAAAIGVSIDTMKLHYFASPELQRLRRNARAITEAELLGRLNEQSKAGKVAATEKLLKRLDKARLGPVPVAQPKAKKAKGLKEQRAEAAKYAGVGDESWGSLLHPKHQA